MYCGYITKLTNVRPHNNADKLLLADCFGNTVCVGLDAYEGQIGLYLPSDGQVSEEFATANDLVRRKDESGKNVGGYLDPNKRNIRAIRLRGERSDGIFLPLTCFAYLGLDESSFKVGDQITTIDGHEVCKKYIPMRPARGEYRGGNRTRKTKINYAPLFQEHADTEQLAYNLGAFKVGDEFEVTLKMHGCFVSGTKVRMADGSLKQIQRIQKGEKVLAYNFETNKFESAEVLNTFKNAPSKHWNKIKISRNGYRGDKRGYYTSTPNHPYWSKELNCWIEAKDLMVGQKISALFPSYILTQQQKEVLVGSYLGDGCLLSFDNKTAELQNSCAKDKEEYIDYFITIMNGYHYKTAQEYTSGYGTQMVRAKTYRSADLYDYFSDITTFNNQPGRKLLDGLVDKFTPLSLAIFYMEDGNLGYSELQEDRALFAICDYTEKEDIEIICKCFKKFNLDPIVYTDPKGYPRIRLNTESAYKMFDLIEKYIPPVMKYKLPEKYRNNSFIVQYDNEEFSKGYVLREQEVLENISIEETHDEYDLETSLHNYIVGMSIVHNTSQRTAHLPVLQGYKRSLLDRILRRQGKPMYKWDYVTGTRRTICKSDYLDGFYGDPFRQKHAAQFEGKLPKGFTVYYEVVGYTEAGVPIMASASNTKLNDPEFIKQYGEVTEFSYGCLKNGKKTMYGEDSDGAYSIEVEAPQSECYVYRITMTNEDGDVVEIDPDTMRYYCNLWGVKCVPKFCKGIITSEGVIVSAPDSINNVSFFGYRDGVGLGDSIAEAITKIAARFHGGPDPIGKTHIREGVVVRITNRPKFTAFKDKNFEFKIIEGLVKDTAAAPDMEEAQELEAN